MTQRRVVITGIGLPCPVGIGSAEVWDSLLEKRCGITRIDTFNPDKFDAQIGGRVKEFKVADFVPKSYRKSTKVMARDIALAVAAAYDAVKDAGLKTKCLIDRGEVEAPPNFDPRRFGTNIGSGLICADLTELAGALATATGDDHEFDFKKWGTEGMTNLTPLWLLKFLPNMLACHVTIVHDAQAPSNTLTCSEASSHLAIGEAFRTISRGAADVCICGGAESKVNPMGLMRQRLLNRLTCDHNDAPESACRPFDVDRKGTAISEGAGLLILEELEHAKKRGARIYAELIGFGAGSNIHDWLTPHPEGAGIKLAMEKALKDAGVRPEDIDLVGAFAVGTHEHDLSEAKAIHGVFGVGGSEVPVLAIKGATGNNGAGSGAIDFAALTMAMHHRTIPPSRNTDNVDPACNLNVIAGDPVDARINVAISTAYALAGGQNVALVVKRYEE